MDSVRDANGRFASRLPSNRAARDSSETGTSGSSGVPEQDVLIPTSTENRSATMPTTATLSHTRAAMPRATVPPRNTDGSTRGQDAVDLEAWIPTDDAYPITEATFLEETRTDGLACYEKLKTLWIAHRAQIIAYDKLIMKYQKTRQDRAVVKAELDALKRVVEQDEGITSQGRGDSSTPASQAFHAGTRYTPKMPDPPALSDGKSPTFDAWVLLMKQKLRANADHFPDSRSEVEYIFSRCEGEAASHLVVPMQDPRRFEVIEDIIEYLTQIYKNPNQRLIAAKDLRDLKMKVNDDFRTFASEYRRMATEARLPEDQWVADFYHKLLDSLQSVMIGLYASHQGSFTQFVNAAGVYAIQHKHIQENRAARERARQPRGADSKSGAAKPPANQNSKNQSTSTNTHTSPNRHADVTCFSCNEKGHISRNCPNKKKEQVKAVAEGGESSKDSENE
jgi:hypothetical protein